MASKRAPPTAEAAAAAGHQGDSPAALGSAPRILPTPGGHGRALQPLRIPPAAPCTLALLPQTLCLLLAKRLSSSCPQQSLGSLHHQGGGHALTLLPQGPVQLSRRSPPPPNCPLCNRAASPPSARYQVDGGTWDISQNIFYPRRPKPRSPQESTRAKVELKYFCSLIHLGMGGGMEGGEGRRRGGGQRGFNRLQ